MNPPLVSLSPYCAQDARSCWINLVGLFIGLIGGCGEPIAIHLALSGKGCDWPDIFSIRSIRVEALRPEVVDGGCLAVQNRHQTLLSLQREVKGKLHLRIGDAPLQQVRMLGFSEGTCRRELACGIAQVELPSDIVELPLQLICANGVPESEFASCLDGP